MICGKVFFYGGGGFFKIYGWGFVVENDVDEFFLCLKKKQRKNPPAHIKNSTQLI